jgi:type I restriction-modification system DNA methylase subunit
LTIEEIKRIVFNKQSLMMISDIFKLTRENKNFSVWLKKYKFTHGVFDKQKEVDLDKLSRLYQIKLQTTDDLFRLIFALENFYVWILQQTIYVKIEQSKGIKKPSYERDKNYFWANGLINFEIEDEWNLISQTMSSGIKKVASEVYYNNLLKYDLFWDFDYIREIYQIIFDKRIRHSVGEFFTPDWLADFIIEKTIEDDPQAYNKTFLDPTCGTGTFLVQVLNKFKDLSDGSIFKHIYGMDLNPVSVLAAKANYLLQYINYFGRIDNKLEIPIYKIDVIHDYPDDEILVDYIVGNPPWINWEYLPEEYKNKTKQVWQNYKLYAGRGLDSNFLKEDISTLITYCVADKFLKNNGKLGFLLKESLIKSARQAKAFRNFHIHTTSTPLKVVKAIDLTTIKPFEGINPRTIALIIEKNSETKFPIKYQVVKTTNKKRTFNMYLKYKDIKEKIFIEELIASPIDRNDLSSSWKTLSKIDMKLSEKILGKSYYQARTGVFAGGGNAMFWLNILNSEDDSVLVENIIARAKNKVDQIQMELEKDYVFPLLVGSDISFWKYKYSKYILCPHTEQTKMNPIDETELAKIPKTRKYFEYFKEDLKKRKGFTGLDKHIHQEYYYSLQRIGDYTFKKYKVAWKYISKEFCPVVIENVQDPYLGYKNIIPNEKIIYIGLDSKDEAYYLCGILSSKIVKTTIESFMIGTQITPSIIKNLNILQFDKNNDLHMALAKSCEKGHKNQSMQEKYLNEVNEIADKIFKL